jgi:hypothetical protein
MGLDHSTFEHLKPSESQIEVMNKLREAAKAYAMAVEQLVPDGPDKTYVLRSHRTNAMWVNIAITRQPDGSPRT